MINGLLKKISKRAGDDFTENELFQGFYTAQTCRSNRQRVVIAVGPEGMLIFEMQEGKFETETSVCFDGFMNVKPVDENDVKKLILSNIVGYGTNDYIDKKAVCERLLGRARS